MGKSWVVSSSSPWWEIISKKIVWQYKRWFQRRFCDNTGQVHFRRDGWERLGTWRWSGSFFPQTLKPISQCITVLYIYVPYSCVTHKSFGMDTYEQVKNKGGHTYLQMASKHSSIVSLCALVRDRPLESLYIVCSVESIREVQCSVPEKRGAHLVRSGSTAEHMYLLSASADSVVLRDTWGREWGH